MTDNNETFRSRNEQAWTYHRNTCRWPFNIHALNTPIARESAFKEHLDAPTVELPKAKAPNVGLSETLARRHSCRQFSDEPISLEQLGVLLRTGYGVLGESDGFGGFLERPVPSGGALYPLELYVLAQNVAPPQGGVLHYLPLTHSVEILHTDKLPRLLTAELFLGQPYLASASAIIVIAAVVERSLWKYEDRGYRYILLEAGHVAQNVILCATGLGLGALPLGGFFDDDLSALLRLDRDREIAIYGVAVGVPSSNDRDASRTPADADGIYRQY
jgi:SagB-type dehydrogenase family enzyme